MAQPNLDATTTTSIAIVGGTSTVGHTVSLAGFNEVITVRIYGWPGTAAGSSPTGVTYALTALTRVAQSAVSGAGDRAEIWRLKAPATGANNVVITWGGGGSAGGNVGVDIQSWMDVDQTTPDGTPQTTTFNGTTPSVTVATNGTDSAIIDCIGYDSAGGSTVSFDAPGGSATRTSEQNSANGGEGFAASRVTSPAASQALGYTLSLSANCAIAAVAINGIAAASATLEQADYRTRFDNGSESAAGWWEAELKGVTAPVSTPFRLRLLVNATGDPAAMQYRLEYRFKDSAGAWTAVATGSGDIRLAASANISAGGTQATTVQLTPPAGKTTTDFQVGEISDDTNPLPAIDLASGKYTEVEFCLQFDPAATPNRAYSLRLTNNGTALDTYTAVPALVLGAGGGGPLILLKA